MYGDMAVHLLYIAFDEADLEGSASMGPWHTY